MVDRSNQNLSGPFSEEQRRFLEARNLSRQANLGIIALIGGRCGVSQETYREILGAMQRIDDLLTDSARSPGFASSSVQPANEQRSADREGRGLSAESMDDDAVGPVLYKGSRDRLLACGLALPEQLPVDLPVGRFVTKYRGFPLRQAKGTTAPAEWRCRRLAGGKYELTIFEEYFRLDEIS